MALGLQCFVVDLLFLGDLNDHLAAQLMPAAFHILAVLSGQADACNGVDEQHRVPAHKALAAQVVEVLQRFEEGQPLDLAQCALLPRQLHDGSGRAQRFHIGAHQGFVGHRLAGAGREDGLEHIAHPLLGKQLLEVASQLCGLCFLLVDLHAELFQMSLVGALDLIEGKVGILFQGVHIGAVGRVPRHTAGNADTQLIAAGQDGNALLHGAAQGADLLTDLILTGIAVEQQHELIAGKAGHHSAVGCVLRKAAASAVDVLVAPVVAVGIIDVLEVVQIHHQQSCNAQLVRIVEQLFAHAVEGLTVIQAGQDIVIAFVLNTHALQRGGGNVLSQPHLRGLVVGDAQHDVAGLALPADGEYLVSLCRGGTGMGKLDVAQLFLKAAHTQEVILGLGGTQQRKKVIGNIHTASVEPQLIAAQLHTGHVHDAQKLCGVVQQLAVQAGQCIGQTVQLPDVGMGQLRELLFLLPVHHFVIQQLHRIGQIAGNDQTAQRAQHQRKHNGNGDHVAHIVCKGKQHLAVHGADQQPALIGKRRVAAVQGNGQGHGIIVFIP